MRQYRRNSERKYLYLVAITVIGIGGLLIALIFGLEYLVTAIPCLIGGAALILLPWLLLVLIQHWRDNLDTKARMESGTIPPKDFHENKD